MKKYKIIKTILAFMTIACLIFLIASPALATLDRLDYQYAHQLNEHTITKVRGCFRVNSWTSNNDNYIWAIEGDYMGVAEAVFAYYPSKSSTDWIVGIAVGGALKTYVEADPSLSYQYLMQIPSKGIVYYKVMQSGNTVLEWLGNAQSSYVEFFTLAYTSNEIINYGSSGDFSAIVTHGFLWVYDEDTDKFLKAYNVYYGKSSNYQVKDILNGSIYIEHTRTNFYWDESGVVWN